jgi:hypothetical protein
MKPYKLWTSSNSQSFQESFVLNATNEKFCGYYIEVGSNHPIKFSNTFVLENHFNWLGIGLEISKNLVDEYNYVRKNLAVCGDATLINYTELFEVNNCPLYMDYLQLDIEPASQTLKALKAIPLHKYYFSVITFEHDLYASPSNRIIQDAAFQILSQFGYQRLIKGVSSHGNAYEDWYIHPDLVNRDFINNWTFTGESIGDTAIFSKAILI